MRHYLMLPVEEEILCLYFQALIINGIGIVPNFNLRFNLHGKQQQKKNDYSHSYGLGYWN